MPIFAFIYNFKISTIMKKMLTIIIVLIISSQARTQDDDAKYAKAIEKLHKAQNTEKTFEVAFDQMFDMFTKDVDKSLLPSLSNFKKEMKVKAIADLLPMLVPVYRKYWSLEDVEQLTAFFESPLGKKMSETQPLIMGESMTVGQEWGRKVGMEIYQKIQEQKKD
jgi:uncharacterized protein